MKKVYGHPVSKRTQLVSGGRSHSYVFKLFPKSWETNFTIHKKVTKPQSSQQCYRTSKSTTSQPKQYSKDRNGSSIVCHQNTTPNSSNANPRDGHHGTWTRTTVEQGSNECYTAVPQANKEHEEETRAIVQPNLKSKQSNGTFRQYNLKLKGERAIILQPKLGPSTCPILQTAASGSQPTSRKMYVHSCSYIL